MGDDIDSMPPKSTQALKEAILSLPERLADLHASMDQRHESIVAVVSDLCQPFSNLPSTPSPPISFVAASPHTPQPLPQHLPSPSLKPPKLFLPLFDGSNPLDWVFQAQQFFFNNVSPEQCLDMVFLSFCLSLTALTLLIGCFKLSNFSFNNVPSEQCLDMVSFMQGDALSWFKWMFTNRQLSSWEAFIRSSLELCFRPSSFDNHQAMLFKLCQLAL
ncbi:UNVERIFIED_CONTAM: hypothetical protein Sangu_3260700 [Sesamum angustifolium]|uniref:Retrotransposon gag domain-containing protein n=1 Tax=Sesamum angustifolium TaxID=2727405 RepID=A0AAW2JAL5_9LAMI